MEKRDIEVKRLLSDEDGMVFSVFVSGGESESSYTVSLKSDTYERLSNGSSPEDLVKRSLIFLIDRGSESDIFSSFDVSDISNKFPDFEEEIIKGRDS